MKARGDIEPLPADGYVTLDGVSVEFPIRGGKRKPWQAVRDVSLTIERGTTVGLVGESGSGKTTLGQTILRQVDVSAGTISFDGQDITRLAGRDLRAMRQRVQLVFQNPVGSLNPRMTVLENIAEPLVAQRLVPNAKSAEERVVTLLDQVGLRRDMMQRFPHQLSGGQCQRVGIARALALDPEFIVADEPVSSLDVSIQAQIVNLLDDLKAHHDGTLLFIAHDLAVVKHIADKVATMYAGEIVEVGRPEDIFAKPLHPYTDALLSVIPLPEYPRREDHAPRLRHGKSPDLSAPPVGCAFASRCPFATERCRTEHPVLRLVEDDRWAACHFASEIDLVGIHR